ncbi:hypothetical protein LY76DRAFT_174793 [Colletotrichum caudatum]|nr:hypothetical protein LY76DRAFT_174793 [Colletotrichum caudatum]
MLQSIKTSAWRRVSRNRHLARHHPFSIPCLASQYPSSIPLTRLSASRPDSNNKPVHQTTPSSTTTDFTTVRQSIKEGNSALGAAIHRFSVQQNEHNKRMEEMMETPHPNPITEEEEEDYVLVVC